jgi:hypothetical protein
MSDLNQAIFYTTLIGQTYDCGTTPTMLHDEDWELLRGIAMDFHSIANTMVVMGTIAHNLESISGLSWEESPCARKVQKVLLSKRIEWNNPSKSIQVVMGVMKEYLLMEKAEDMRKALVHNMARGSNCHKDTIHWMQSISCTLVASENCAYQSHNPMPPGAEDFLPLLRGVCVALNTAIGLIVTNDAGFKVPV